MKFKNQCYIFLFLITIAYGCNHATNIDSENTSSNDDIYELFDSIQRQIFAGLKVKDSILFELGFNQCDTHQVRIATSTNFEFYHDQAGITKSQEAFIKSISELCSLPYKASRELVEGSLTVDILKKNGEVYGAIQLGKHKFYAKEPGMEKYLTSTADFIHLWIIEENTWKLKRVFSYNHTAIK